MVVAALAGAPSALAADNPIRVGIIGCDTSHAPKFAAFINHAKPGDALAGLQVVAAYPTSSDDIASSRDRVEKYTEELRSLGVKIVDSLPELLTEVDAVMIESVDGRRHLEQFSAVAAAGKPAFVDKPAAASMVDVVKIYDEAAAKNVPCFSSSALRFSPALVTALADKKLGKISGCDAYSPCHLEEHHPDLYWYGIHGVETLFTVMGPGCESVTRTQSDSAEVVVGVWKDGRIGTFRGIHRGAAKYGATIYGQRAVVDCPINDVGYAPLVIEIGRFFETGKPPVSAEQTLEIYAFMEAADESKRRGGAAVKVEDVLQAARAAAAQTAGK